MANGRALSHSDLDELLIEMGRIDSPLAHYRPTSVEFRRLLMDKYVHQETDYAVKTANHKLLSDVTEQWISDMRKQSERAQEMHSPFLSNYTYVDPDDGILKPARDDWTLTDAFDQSLVASANAMKKGYYATLGEDAEAWDIPLIGRVNVGDLGYGAVGLAGGAAEFMGFGKFKPFKWWMELVSRATGKTTSSEDFDRWYNQVVNTNQESHAGNFNMRWFATSVGEMLPLIVAMFGLGGAGSVGAGGRAASAAARAEGMTLGRAVAGATEGAGGLTKLWKTGTTTLGYGLGRVGGNFTIVNPFLEALAARGMTGQAATMGVRMAMATAMNTPTRSAINPATGMREEGAIDPTTGEFKPVTFWEELGDKLFAGVGAGAAAFAGAMGGHAVLGLIGSSAASMAATEGAAVASHWGARAARAATMYATETLAFTGSASISDFMHSGEFSFGKHLATNAILFAGMKGLHLVPKVPGGVKKFIVGKGASETGKLTFTDRVGVYAETLKSAKEKGGNIRDLVKEYKRRGHDSRLGRSLRNFSEITKRPELMQIDAMELEMARGYAEGGVKASGETLEAIRSDYQTFRENLVKSLGHSDVLEGSAAKAKLDARDAEESGVAEQQQEMLRDPNGQLLFDFSDTRPNLQQASGRGATEVRLRSALEPEGGTTKEQKTEARAYETAEKARRDNVEVERVMNEVVRGLKMDDTISVETDPNGGPARVQVLRSVEEHYNDMANRAIRKFKDRVSSVGKRWKQGALGRLEKAWNRAQELGGRANDITVGVEMLAEMVKDMPKTSKGLIVGGMRTLGDLGHATVALGTAVFAEGMGAFTRWRSRMIQKTNGSFENVPDPVARQIHEHSKRLYVREMKKVVGGLPGIKELMKLAKKGRSGHNWYETVEQPLRKLMSDSNGRPIMVTWQNSAGRVITKSAFDLFTAALSATSSGKNVDANLTLATRAVTELLTYSGVEGRKGKPNWQARRSYDIRETDKGHVIYDKETGEVVSNQVIKDANGRTRRVKFYKNRADASERLAEIRAMEEQRSASLMRDQNELLNIIFERGDLPLKAPNEGRSYTFRKRWNFLRALRGDHDAITLDIWGLRAMGWYKAEKKGKNKGRPILDKNGRVREYKVTDWRYDHFEHVVREVAEKMGWTPRQAQAAIWAGTKMEWGEKGWTSSQGASVGRFESSLVLNLARNGRFRQLMKLPVKNVMDFFRFEAKKGNVEAEGLLRMMVEEGIDPKWLETRADLKAERMDKIKRRITECV